MDSKQRILKLIIRSISVIVVLVFVSTLYSFYRGGSNTDIAFSDSQISFSDPAGKEVVIPYGDIVSIKLVNSPDYGEPQDGAIENNTRIGTWKSDDLGTYITYTSTHIESCILIQTSNNTYAVNYESKETTALLLEELTKYL